MNTSDWPMRAADLDLRVRNFINGGYVDTSTGDSLIDKRSPRDGSLLYQLGSGTTNDVNNTVTNAKEVFDDGCWYALPFIC